MPVNFRPEGFHTVTPYIMVDGVEKLIAFAVAAFGAETPEVMKSPEGRVMHAQIKIGDSMLMLADANPPEWSAQPTSFYLYVEDCDAWYNAAIAAGGTSIMPPIDQFYGDRHGGAKDPCGNSWWLATHIEDVSSQEMARRMEEWAKKREANDSN